ncbi:alpha-hydroxy-acid oxidizing protein [Gordonia humi]|uniref:Isopentenyl diphosphate isomerase/L-lactate dehydrogenase-like FMN-dependent dehydrogenase n=1 Tax=Gordonia humi TaxID=686429 RepID=A0A840EP65_9ACTN|nr:alpha-hydroxy-acid oxidizing protein [Gordonia humi]MBB4133502.1 isopentenyl diphosphate isomerase/L-lactate dehydrogenase-like FMN-dependent dehydrogenase [Gordonia humi]
MAQNYGRARQNEIYSAGIHGRTPSVPTDFATLERRARARMSRRGWAYVAGGAGEGRTMAANREALDRWAIVPRMLRDTSDRDLATDLFGQTLPAPILFSPVGAGALAHDRADVHIGHAAAELGLPYIFSNQGCAPMEDVAAEMESVRPGAPRWFQLYWSTDDRLVRSLVSRAEAMGAAAIVVTLDTTMLGWRPQDLNLGSLPFARAEGIDQYTSDPTFWEIVAERLKGATKEKPEISIGAIKTLLSIARNVPGELRRNLTAPEPRAAVETFLDIYSRPSLNWDDLAVLRELTDLPIVLKGVLHPDDALEAVERGVDGIIVSNHGGRQVDGSISSTDALVDVVDAVSGRLKILVDSGFYTGSDVFKALALGADAVCIGRPHMYGLALNGADGARDAVANIVAELDLTLGLSGQSDVRTLTRSALKRL